MGRVFWRLLTSHTTRRDCSTEHAGRVLSSFGMRWYLSLTIALLSSCTAMAQSSAPSGGPPSSPPASATTPAPPPGPTGTSSQQNLDIKPPTTSVPPAQQGTQVAPTPPQAASPGSQDDSTKTPLGSGRPQPGGANSSPETARTGKNPANETYSSSLRMWERGTHMSWAEWARACRRVADRLRTLKVQ